LEKRKSDPEARRLEKAAKAAAALEQPVEEEEEEEEEKEEESEHQEEDDGDENEDEDEDEDEDEHQVEEQDSGMSVDDEEEPGPFVSAASEVALETVEPRDPLESLDSQLPPPTAEYLWECKLRRECDSKYELVQADVCDWLKREETLNNIGVD